MKSLNILIISLFLLLFFSNSITPQDPNGWQFIHGQAVSFDTANMFTYVAKYGQYFQTAGVTAKSGEYYVVGAQWYKQFFPVDNARVAPDSFRCDVKILNPQDLDVMHFKICFQGTEQSMFPAAEVLALDTLWHTWSFSTDGIKDVIYVSLVFTCAVPESSYVVLKVMVKNLTLVYKDSTVVLDPMMDVATGVAEGEKSTIPSTSQLMQNYPNPFNPSTTIPYVLNEGGDVDLQVFDLLGREVILLERGYKPAGTHTTRFDGSSLPSGTYCALLRFNGKPMGVRKLLLVK